MPILIADAIRSEMRAEDQELAFSVVVGSHSPQGYGVVRGEEAVEVCRRWVFCGVELTDHRE
jgi:hypothetical protein